MSARTSGRYPAELHERAVRMFAEVRCDHESPMGSDDPGGRAARGGHTGNGAHVVPAEVRSMQGSVPE